MNARWITVTVSITGLLLALAVGLAVWPGAHDAAWAQGPGPQGGDVPQAPLGTAFTYQGRLTDGGSPASGEYDFEFKLYNAASGGTLLGTVTVGDHTVTDGLFTVELDFGDVFGGDALYLGIGVRPGSSIDAYTPLTPRQALTAAPYALSLRPGAYIHDKTTSGNMAGIYLQSDNGKGVQVTSAGDDGVHVIAAGSPSTTTHSADHNGFEVSGAQGNGLFVGRADGHGVVVGQAGEDGVVVGQAGDLGVFVAEAGGYGVGVGTAGSDGVHVDSVGSPSATYDSSDKNGFEVAGAEGSGLYVGQADEHGVWVLSAGYDGVIVMSAGQNGVYVVGADGDGVIVGDAGSVSGGPVFWSGSDGVEVGGAEDHGLWVGRAGGAGAYIYSAGGDGVYVAEADGNGVYANTTQASHEWGVYTPDKIYAGTTLASGGPLMIVAQSGDSGKLETGDVVAVSGAGTALADGEAPVPLVRRAGAADAAADAVVGVVYRRFVSEERVTEVERDGQVERSSSLHTRSTDGPIAPGEYLLIVVLGPAQVQAAAVSGDIRPGDRLTAGDAGQVQKATPVKVGDAAFYPPGTIVGTAMETLKPSQASGLIWVLVRPQ